MLERLGRETDETVHLVMRDERDVVYIHKIDGGNSAIRMFSRIGMRLPLYCTGVGKAILATWPRSEARAVWEASDVYAWTENTITDEEAFFREIDKVRQLGYALDNEENEVGVRCIAAAIPDYRGRAFYAISLSAPTARMADERIMQLRGPLLRHRAGARRQHGTLTRGTACAGELHPVKPEHSPNIDIAAQLL